MTLTIQQQRDERMTNLNPKVSVIIPTYNEEQNIEGCLKSVVNQDFSIGKIESIVVDSHSQDNTRAIAQKHADKVIDLKARGVGKARNAGAKIAKSPILLFVDADTYLETNFVAELYRTFTDPRVICVSGVLRNLERLKPLDTLFALSHYGFLNNLATVTARFGFPLFASVCCSCRKTAFEQVGGFAEDLAVAEDIMFSRKMGKIGKCVVNRKATAYTSVRRISNCGKTEMYSMYFKNYVRVFVLNQKPWIQDFPHVP